MSAQIRITEKRDRLTGSPETHGDPAKAILAGTQSARVTVESLREPIPLDWSEQKKGRSD